MPEHALWRCAQVEWGTHSGKYLSAAVGTARAYIQVRHVYLRELIRFFLCSPHSMEHV